jgi:hypothetical protein
MGAEYADLIPQNPLKVARSYLQQLTCYLDSRVPEFFILHEVVGVIRYIQLLMPAFAASYTLFWKNGSVGQSIADILTVSCHLVPSSFLSTTSIFVQFVYIAIMGSGLLLTLISAFIIERTGKIEMGYAVAITLFLQTLQFTLHDPMIEVAGEQLGHLIMGEPLHFAVNLEVTALVLSVIIFLVTLWIYLRVTAVSLVFRPMPLICVCPSAQTRFTLISYVITLLIGIGPALPKSVQIAIFFASALGYLASAATVWMPGSFIAQTHSKVVLACSLTGFVQSIIVAGFLLSGEEADFLILFLGLAVLGISYFIATAIIRSRVVNHLLFLDQFRDNPAVLDQMRSPSALVPIEITGMYVAHPSCLDWSLFRAGTERWSDDSVLWTVFARFVAIYPEESALLQFIVWSVANEGMKDNMVNMVKTQASVLQRQRETQLSIALKRKTSHVQKELAATKRKLRNVWDLVIQGNIKEMESSITMAYNSVLGLTNSYNHMLEM